MEAVKAELTEILLALVKGLKVVVVYIVPSVLISIAIVPDLVKIITENPSTLTPYLINAVILAITTYFAPKIEKLTPKG